jgi:hypothetical protein
MSKNIFIAENLHKLYKIYSVLLIILSVLLIINIVRTSSVENITKPEINLINQTSAMSEFAIFGNEIFNRTTRTNDTCYGDWFFTNKTGKIDLISAYLSEWKLDSPPTLLADTKLSKNTVIIGHNLCQNGSCYKVGSSFAGIINLNIGDTIEVCHNGYIYKGYVLYSSAIPDTRIEVLGDWTGFSSFTFFTSFGKCKDMECSSTDQRWLVVMEK